MGRINNLLGARPTFTAPLAQPSVSASPGIKLHRLQRPEQIKKEATIWQKQVKQATQKANLRPISQTPPPRPTVTPTTAPTQGPIVEVVPPPRPASLTVASLYPALPQSQKKMKVAPEFAQDLPLPTPPEAPNLITGMVVTMEDRLLPNSIVEICNSQNQTVRAFKTNKLGQFFIATPLSDGDYEIRMEHPEYGFDIIKFKAEGKIIPPIKIRAKAKITTNEVGNQGIGVSP
ncbi:hypothetical protein A2160_04935 [Candidatus Beckwithbacteria bacterium RBG_13_42_9]|uniref:Carboxypeptidase regulatory-like domain-containing protein n=1 Tax=Candidatus Beckwithbacteria bacterium RBG_13_42_9 TaxID=1797457 RepID=A0A1F5E620_9BACT|nr:MAG: hypothetical protein A2160_04935 [Candidatus Beckwithbacteria bacterium RBG_13_42_9]